MNATLARLTRLAADLRHEGDSRLLDRFLAGSQAAFRELVTRHSALVYGVCHRILRHHHDAEDAFQAVFLVLARRAADVWPRDAVGSWLYGVASRVALKARLLRARRMSREQHLVEVADARSAGPEPDTAEVVDRVVRKLPQVYREAVIACDLEGLSRKDAAGQLGWSEGTLSGRLARARRILAGRLRRAGLALPAGGLAAVFATDAPVRARLEEDVMRLISAGAGSVPAPVVALTEGVVPSMLALNFKSAVAAVVVVCTIGLGAWAGAGTEQGDGAPVAAAASPEPQSQPKTLPPKSQPARLPAGLEVLQGHWRIASMTENGIADPRVIGKDDKNEITIRGATLTMPYREADGGRKEQEFKIAVDDAKQPKTIDLIAPRKPVGKGIYEFIAPHSMCNSCHDTSGLQLSPERHLLENWLLKGTEFHSSCQPGNKVATGLRLAVALEGDRPTKFTGEKVVVFTLERVGSDPTGEERQRLERERARLVALLESVVAEEQRKDLLNLLSKQQVAAAELEVEDARAQLRTAAARCDEAQAHAERANYQFTLASRKLQEAQAKLDAAEKARAGKELPDLPAKDGAVITIHIRPLAAPEKVIRVKATGSDTILEAMAHAAQEMAIKPEAFSAWIVRGKEIMSVDLAGILQRGETRTNYVLKAGDQLFVQARVDK
jgi:RNA polymerase sigma factor (sigma-70 family)